MGVYRKNIHSKCLNGDAKLRYCDGDGNGVDCESFEININNLRPKTAVMIYNYYCLPRKLFFGIIMIIINIMYVFSVSDSLNSNRKIYISGWYIVN